MAKNGSHDIMDVVEGRITLDEFVSELSIDDLIHLLGGQPNTGVANTLVSVTCRITVYRTL